MDKVSIIIATKNRQSLLEKSLAACLELNYSDFEILVTNDGSTDNTKQFLEQIQSKNSKIKVFHHDRSKGPATARNTALKHASGKYCVILDDDCIPTKEWLKNLIQPFAEDEKIGVTSSFSYWGGTSTAYRMDLFQRIGFFDESFPMNYREDTDTIFKILDLGYSVKMVTAKFDHIHPQPETGVKKLEYAWKRIWLHQYDALLYKKHPQRGREFFDVKFGFLRNPLADYKAASGQWWSKDNFVLSSPQGITFIENKSPFHAGLIVLSAVGYATIVKVPRLYGSLKFGKLLI